MNKFILLILIIITVTGCKSLKQALGIDKDVPDEFLIKKIDPIERPPNFDLLPPDTKVKSKKDSQIKAKEIIDQNLKKNSNKKKELQTSEVSTSLEKDILNQINKK